MLDVAPTVSAILELPAPAQSKGRVIQEMARDLEGCKVAILATDALGEYAWGLWKDEMPYLKALHAQRSIILESAMPSITPVNFSTMVTGTDLAGHGMRTKELDFQCETLFDVVRKAGGRSAGIGLDGYTGSRAMGRFADIWGNAGRGSDDDVADKIIEIADQYEPEFLIAQLGRVDDVFHRYGPSSPWVVPMLRRTDGRLKRLIQHLKPLGYGIIVLSDHGQHDLTKAKAGEKKGGHGKDRPKDRLVPCTWA